MVPIYLSLLLRSQAGVSFGWMVSQEVYTMKIRKEDITVALAYRTKELLMARKALYAAATIHTTTVVVLLAGLAVLLHAVYA
jgi:hypothetical protein